MTLVNFACIGKKGWILALAEGKKKMLRFVHGLVLGGKRCHHWYKVKDAED